ncbi:MAG: hypothetical protein M3401_00360 [Actinomycetota bacterium]|nr:hypothetical protein [Actinomycetota bacterium]
MLLGNELKRVVGVVAEYGADIEAEAMLELVWHLLLTTSATAGSDRPASRRIRKRAIGIAEPSAAFAMPTSA